jgi:hypothetical protein
MSGKRETMGTIRTRGIEAPTRSRKGYMRAIARNSRFGRVKLAARREFLLADGQLVSTPAVMRRAYPRLRRYNRSHYLAAYRALRQLAVMVARNRHGRGRPGLWLVRGIHAT